MAADGTLLFDINVNTDGIKKAGKIAGGVLAGIAGAAVLTTQKYDDLAKSAVALGTSVGGLDSLRYASDLAGVSASELDSILGKMQKTVLANEAAYSAFGVSIYNTDGTLKGTEEILVETINAMAGMSDAERLAAADSIGLSKNIETLNKLSNNASGLTQTYTDDLNKNGESVEELAVKSEAFQDALTNLQRRISEIVVEIGLWVIENKNLVFALIIMLSLIVFISIAMLIYNQVMIIIKGITLMITALKWSEVAAWWASVWPILLVILIIALVIMAYRQFEIVQIIINTLLNIFVGIITIVLNVLKFLWDIVVIIAEVFINIFGTAIGIVIALFQWLWEKLDPVWNIFQKIFDICKWLADLFMQTFGPAIEFVTDTFAKLFGWLEPVWNLLEKIINGFKSLGDKFNVFGKSDNAEYTPIPITEGMSEEERVAAETANAFGANAVSSLSIGTDYVNSDGLAMLHAGEMVMPAADVEAGGYSGGQQQQVVNVTVNANNSVNPDNFAKEIIVAVDEYFALPRGVRQ